MKSPSDSATIRSPGTPRRLSGNCVGPVRLKTRSLSARNSSAGSPQWLGLTAPVGRRSRVRRNCGSRTQPRPPPAAAAHHSRSRRRQPPPEPSSRARPYRRQQNGLAPAPDTAEAAAAPNPGPNARPSPDLVENGGYDATAPGQHCGRCSWRSKSGSKAPSRRTVRRGARTPCYSGGGFVTWKLCRVSMWRIQLCNFGCSAIGARPSGTLPK